MAHEKFKSTDLGGPSADPAEIYRIYAPHWDLVLLCERAGLYRREGQVLIGWVMDLTPKQISAVTGMALPHIAPTWKRALQRLAPFLEPEASCGTLEATRILIAFRNARTRAGHGDHGPQIQGTRYGNYREVYPPRLVVTEDLTGERPGEGDPLVDGLLRRMELD